MTSSPPCSLKERHSRHASAKLHEMTACQSDALPHLRSERNIFLTGAAGTGKSYLLRHYMDGCDPERCVTVASTGAAAILIGGRTFHSFFGLGILEGGHEETLRRAQKNKPLKQRLQRAETIIVDEVSMLSGDTLAIAEHIARMARKSERSWGGLRMIVVGDFAQLPPVPVAGRRDWAFDHTVWHTSRFHPLVLQTSVRTGNHAFLSVLRQVRLGIVDDLVTHFLDSKRCHSTSTFNGTRLFGHRHKAEQYNLERLQRVSGSMHRIDTIYNGDRRAIEQLKKNAPIGETLSLKKGALIMLRKNDTSARYCNGTLGTVSHIHSDTIDITLLDGTEVQVEKMHFSLLDGNGKEIATAWNFPLTLAWATTIHKAQGASLDRLMINLSQLWEPGQAYTALSRAKNPEHLFIEDWQPSSIIADSSVRSLYTFMERSEQRTRTA